MIAKVHSLIVAAFFSGHLVDVRADDHDVSSVDIVEHLSYSEKDGEFQLEGFYVAKRSDYEDCLDWQPTDAEQKLPLKKIVEIARRHIEAPTPAGNYRYGPPELRGVDFRNLLYPNRLWYWDVHFVFNIDHESTKGIMIRDGERSMNVRLLPNGGLIRLRPPTAKDLQKYEDWKRSSAKSNPFDPKNGAEQDGAEQAATRSQSDSEGDVKPQAETERRSR